MNVTTEHNSPNIQNFLTLISDSVLKLEIATCFEITSQQSTNYYKHF
jgi:hypothetical protein